MTRISICIAMLALAVTAVSAQPPPPQPNQELATLKIEGNEGPPYPIANIFVFGGTQALMEITGGANVHFLLMQAPSLTVNSFPFLGGTVHLDILSDPSAVVALMDGFGGSPDDFKTDSNGRFERLYPVPVNVQQNLQLAFQAVLEEPASPWGFELTAATSIIAFPGITPLNYNLGDDNCLFANTQSQFGISIPFYGASYNGCWICANGYITFGSSSTDFTPTLGEMHSGPPRISPFWCDLDPTVGGAGPITLTVDQIDPQNPVLTFRYNSIPDWPVGVNGGLGWHTFGARIDIVSGDVEIHEFPSNQNSNYDILTGLSAGGSLDPTGAGTMDLSGQFAGGPYIGQPNEGFYEGFLGNTSVTGAFPASQSWDLSGNYWIHNAIGAGSPGAFYIMDFFIPLDPNNP